MSVQVGGEFDMWQNQGWAAYEWY